jgi:hypothetical protein
MNKKDNTLDQLFEILLFEKIFRLIKYTPDTLYFSWQ